MDDLTVKNNLEVAVLLSTYNGSCHIIEQLESLARQKYKNFRVYVRDDGSTDDTVQKLKEYEGLDLIIVDDSLGNLGPAGSFMQLMSEVEADIYLFCDQDDYWLENKTESLVAALIDIDGLVQKTPTVVHSNVEIVDASLNSTHRYFHTSNTARELVISHPQSTFLHNRVVGCSAAFNKSLRDKCIQISTSDTKLIKMHDWWLYICAAYFGDIKYIDLPLVKYRQHGSNVSGFSSKNNLWKLLLKKNRFLKVSQSHATITNQTITFLRLYSPDLRPDQRKNIKKVISLLNKGLISHLKLHSMGVRFSSFRILLYHIAYFLMRGRLL